MASLPDDLETSQEELVERTISEQISPKFEHTMETCNLTRWTIPALYTSRFLVPVQTAVTGDGHSSRGVTKTYEDKRNHRCRGQGRANHSAATNGNQDHDRLTVLANKRRVVPSNKSKSQHSLEEYIRTREASVFEDIIIADGVVHGYNWTKENWAIPEAAVTTMAGAGFHEFLTHDDDTRLSKSEFPEKLEGRGPGGDPFLGSRGGPSRISRHADMGFL